VANVSHDLRSPLTAIRAYAELLQEGIGAGDMELERHFLSIIEGQVDRLGQTITNLLDLSRLEAEGYRDQRQEFVLDDLITEVVEAARPRASTRSVRLDVHGPAEKLVLTADRPILVTMLANLVDNAIKYSPDGSRVVVRAKRGGPHIILAVRDFGIGIPDEERPRLFQKFSRLPSASRLGVDGTGLGLVIAREAARAHGGDIRVRSASGRGSTFTVVLPASLLAKEAVAGSEEGQHRHGGADDRVE
jgi:signal transduction histidine kinase